MKNNNINHVIILFLFIIGIGSCGVATMRSEGNGWNGLIPGIFGLFFLAAGVIYLAAYLISSIFIKRELKFEKAEYEDNLDFVLQLRKTKLLKLLSISLVTYSLGIVLPYFLTYRYESISILSIIFHVSLLIISYLGMLKNLKFIKIIWLTTLILLFIKSITFLALSIFDSRYTIIYIAIPITYLYIIGILIKSNLINNKNFQDMV